MKFVSLMFNDMFCDYNWFKSYQSISWKSKIYIKKQSIEHCYKSDGRPGGIKSRPLVELWKPFYHFWNKKNPFVSDIWMWAGCDRTELQIQRTGNVENVQCKQWNVNTRTQTHTERLLFIFFLVNKNAVN